MGDLATSELLLEETPYLKLTTRGRKTGSERNVELWFVFEDGRLLFLAHEDSQWWRNIAQNPKVQVEAGEILFEGIGKLVPERLAHAFQVFRRKYGDNQIERWYGGKRARRKAVEVELGRVLGKRPTRTSTVPQMTI
ncbi:hypothetical protein AUG19_08585 [archaeon 13_1_20CM_2_54_9]|nr:MAG: hypothetical protein AUJ07_12415 [Crenarchaeota archaeon 13_1_40CM_3_53_5]OLE74459.1 MAG: hypothetical protein AUG19_08585 [archaeon 13_1_20CM_2_54_9]